MSTIDDFRKQWVGRKFECNKTGETLVIPATVRECDFFSFGECFIDVGRHQSYMRAGGDFMEILEILPNMEITDK